MISTVGKKKWADDILKYLSYFSQETDFEI